MEVLIPWSSYINIKKIKLNLWALNTNLASLNLKVLSLLKLRCALCCVYPVAVCDARVRYVLWWYWFHSITDCTIFMQYLWTVQSSDRSYSDIDSKIQDGINKSFGMPKMMCQNSSQCFLLLKSLGGNKTKILFAFQKFSSLKDWHTHVGERSPQFHISLTNSSSLLILWWFIVPQDLAIVVFSTIIIPRYLL